MSVTTLQQLSELVGARVVGDPTTKITSAFPLQDAEPDCLTLADNSKQSERVNACPAAAVLVSEPLDACSMPMLICDDPHKAFQKIIALLRPARPGGGSPGIHASAVVDSSVTLGIGTNLAAGATIGADCTIGERCNIHSGVCIMPGCTLGDDCEVFPNVTLYSDTRLGNRVTLHSGSVIGAYGFGYKQQSDKHVRTAQLGWVELGDDVEIGAGATVDRGTYGATKIGEGTKIDNLVQIGHNCHIGRHNIICAQVGIAGSSTTGDNVVFAGQSGMRDHMTMGDNVTVGAQAGVITNIDAGQVVFGTPAIPRMQKLREVALLSRLPEMKRDLRKLQKEVAALTTQTSNDSSETDANRKAA